MSASINRKATQKKKGKRKSQRSQVAGQKAGGDKEEAERQGGGQEMGSQSAAGNWEGSKTHIQEETHICQKVQLAEPFHLVGLPDSAGGAVEDGASNKSQGEAEWKGEWEGAEGWGDRK